MGNKAGPGIVWILSCSYCSHRIWPYTCTRDSDERERKSLGRSRDNWKSAITKRSILCFWFFFLHCRASTLSYSYCSQPILTFTCDPWLTKGKQNRWEDHEITGEASSLRGNFTDQFCVFYFFTLYGVYYNVFLLLTSHLDLYMYPWLWRKGNKVAGKITG